MIQLRTKYASNPLINASGCLCSTVKMLDQVLTSVSGSIITKSATISPRAGNPEPRYWECPTKSLTINSMGLPNCGIKYYLDYYKNADSHTKTRFLSIAGLTLEENKAIFDIIFASDTEYYKYIDVIELNISCPNLVGQSVAGFQELETYLLDLVNYYTKHVASTGLTQNNLRLGIKMPPYFYPEQFDAIVAILSKEPISSTINFIHTINSIPNGLVIDAETESTVIKPKAGFGGLGGPIIKPVALANVRAFYTRFKDAGLAIDIIASGGITTGLDVFEFILAGAEMVSIGSQLMIEGPKCFDRILTELEKIMEAKCYLDLNMFRGNLKTIT